MLLTDLSLLSRLSLRGSTMSLNSLCFSSGTNGTSWTIRTFRKTRKWCKCPGVTVHSNIETCSKQRSKVKEKTKSKTAAVVFFSSLCSFFFQLTIHLPFYYYYYFIFYYFRLYSPTQAWHYELYVPPGGAVYVLTTMMKMMDCTKHRLQISLKIIFPRFLFFFRVRLENPAKLESEDLPGLRWANNNQSISDCVILKCKNNLISIHQMLSKENDRFFLYIPGSSWIPWNSWTSWN